MILIADSGSTKTSWCLIENNGKTAFCETRGLNPFFVSTEEIIAILGKEFKLSKVNLDKLFFYGAGCLDNKKPILLSAFQDFFEVGHIEIYSDLLAAARALCQQKPGIVGILGTGSNSGYYNGEEIELSVPPLGFILGDEGSGSDLGKQFIADLLKNQLPVDLKENFYNNYSFTTAEILDEVYRNPFPNRFLAKFSYFIYQNRNRDYINRMIKDRFRAFFVRNLTQYKEIHSVPLYLTGSIAFVFRDELTEIANEFNLKIQNIEKTPMSGLIKYHTKKDE